MEECIYMVNAIEKGIKDLALEVSQSRMRQKSWDRSLLQ